MINRGRGFLCLKHLFLHETLYFHSLSPRVVSVPLIRRVRVHHVTKQWSLWAKLTTGSSRILRRIHWNVSFRSSLDGCQSEAGYVVRMRVMIGGRLVLPKTQTSWRNRCQNSQGSGWPKAFVFFHYPVLRNICHTWFWWPLLVVYTLEYHDHCHRKLGTAKN